MNASAAHHQWCEALKKLSSHSYMILDAPGAEAGLELCPIRIWPHPHLFEMATQNGARA
jgi:hypothetical protein